MLGLGPADFEVLDNGVPQAVELVSYDQIPLNVVLAFDMSDSVAGERPGAAPAPREMLAGVEVEPISRRSSPFNNHGACLERR